MKKFEVYLRDAEPTWAPNVIEADECSYTSPLFPGQVVFRKAYTPLDQFVAAYPLDRIAIVRSIDS